MALTDWPKFHPYILQLEQEGKVTRTFRRLDPERQKAVVDAILAEATDKGPASLNIKEIARRADVAVGSLYQYFPNREGLLDFAIELCVRYIIGVFTEYRSMLASLPLRDALRYYLQGGVEWGQTEIGLVRFFGRAAYQGDPDLAARVVQPIAEVMGDTMREILKQAAVRGEIRPEVDLEATARTINALMIAVGDSQMLPYLNIYFQVTDDEVSAERVVDALIKLILSGIGSAYG